MLVVASSLRPDSVGRRQRQTKPMTKPVCLPYASIHRATQWHSPPTCTVEPHTPAIHQAPSPARSGLPRWHQLRALRNFVFDSRPSATCRLTSLSGKAMRVSTENALSASVTDIVPIAEERRPEKGKESGPREHCELMLIRPTTVESVSTRAAVSFDAPVVKMAACCPFQELAKTSRTSSTSENVPTGMTGPNCSSWKRRILEVTG
mmetsp:Transcript_25768/g.58584  ORF Transcript_25768/g.58584 Transcript_25768/m.58584 type:complete len:206 (+) Transcript_25768:251-868(+)